MCMQISVYSHTTRCGQYGAVLRIRGALRLHHAQANGSTLQVSAQRVQLRLCKHSTSVHVCLLCVNTDDSSRWRHRKMR